MLNRSSRKSRAKIDKHEFVFQEILMVVWAMGGGCEENPLLEALSVLSRMSLIDMSASAN